MADMEKFVWFLLIGLCAGWIASQIARIRGYGLIEHLIIGIAGAIIGGFVVRLLGFKSVSILGELITATVGALVLLVVLRAFAPPRQKPKRSRR